MPDNSLAGKVVLITGGARRIGASIARLLHAQDMQLVIHYRSSKEEARQLQQELHQTRPESVMLVRGDVLINNASSFYPTLIGKAGEKEWEDLIGSNLKAPFFLSQAAAPHLKKTNGCIINMADIHGKQPLKTYPIYSIAKAGIIMLTKSLARELGPEVRVNAIAPGTILWPENDLDEMAKQRIISRAPQKRAGHPDDIAKTILFLI